MRVQADHFQWLALDVILYAIHDWLSSNEARRKSAEVFFAGDPNESLYLLWLDILEINIERGIPTPEELVEMLQEAGYKSPLDARASKLHQLSQQKSP